MTQETDSRNGSFFSELKRRKVVRVAITYGIVAWIVIQIASIVFPTLGIPVWALRMVVVCVLLGFPIALVLAWAFELTPEGIKTTKRADLEHSPENYTASEVRKRNIFALSGAAIIPALIFGSIALYFYLQIPGKDQISEEGVELASETIAPGKSIAVLPFDNRSELKSDEFFTDGIHDDLLTQISHIRDIKTISRTSVMSYKNTEKNMKQIGEELGVATLLEGGVQRAGDRIRINMQLIDAETDTHIWAETYTYELSAENVFEIQSEITLAIAKELKAVLLPEEQERMDTLPTDNLEALEAYFKGLVVDYSTEALENSVTFLNQAVELDPDFALAHAQLAIAYHNQIWYSGYPLEQQAEKAEPHLNRALELDSELSEAWTVRGMIERDRRNLDVARESYEKALELNPNNDIAYFNYCILLYWDDNDFDNGMFMINKAIELNPDDPNMYIQKAEMLGRNNREDEASSMWALLDRKYPANANVQMRIAETFMYDTGAFNLAYKAQRKAHFLDVDNPQVVADIVYLFDALDEKDNKRFWIDRGVEFFPDSEFAVFFNIQSFLLDNDLEKAHQYWLSEFSAGNIRSNVSHLNLIYVMSNMDLLASHPERVLERYNLLAPDIFIPNPEPELPIFGSDYRTVFNQLFIAVALRDSGEAEQAELMLDYVVKEMESQEPNSFSTNMARTQQGRSDEVIANFKEQDLDVWGEDFSEYFFIEVLSDPYFEGLRARRADWNKEMLEKIEEMESKGELAPIP